MQRDLLRCSLGLSEQSEEEWREQSIQHRWQDRWMPFGNNNEVYYDFIPSIFCSGWVTVLLVIPHTGNLFKQPVVLCDTTRPQNSNTWNSSSL